MGQYVDVVEDPSGTVDPDVPDDPGLVPFAVVGGAGVLGLATGTVPDEEKRPELFRLGW